MQRLILGLAASAMMATLAWADDLSVNARVERAMFAEHRSEANVARNRYRHPVGTLEFFGLSDGMSVLEIWPGAGWYTEVLAPVLRDQGQLTIAAYDTSVAGQPEYRYRLTAELDARAEALPAVFDQLQKVAYSPPESASLGAAEAYDMVLTFRNVHGWVTADVADSIFAEFARVLKAGGVLGVVQHRAATGAEPTETAPQGYVSEEAVIAMAEAAGFVFEASSEVNANPRDTKDHPQGVWTLPPVFQMGDEDRDRYAAIGESDRMTLRFRKPQ